MLSHGIPPIIVAGILGHSLAILMTTYAHIARFARDACLARFARDACLAHLALFARYAPCGRNIPGAQDEPLGFAVTCPALWRSLASAARLMDGILTPIPIDLRMLEK